MDGIVVFSCGIDEGVRDAEAAVVGGGIFLASEARGALFIGVARPGTVARGETPAAGSEGAGEADKDGALNGWNDIDGRRP